MNTGSSNNSTNNATSMFIDHVKQVLLNLPPVTKFALFGPSIVLILSKVTSALFNTYLLDLNYWCYLDSDLVIYSLQIQRLVLYPLTTQFFVSLFVTTIWLFPEIYKAEKKMGSLRLLWNLVTLFTIVPGLIYVIFIQLMTAYAPELNVNGFGYFGMAGWVVGLVLVNYLKYDDSQQDRMVAGSISIPSKAWPIIVLIFFVFLAPGASFILNATTALIAYAYGNDKVPKTLIPSEETITQYESKTWLRPLTRSSNFVSADSSGVYLPIFNPPGRFSTATTVDATNAAPPTANNNAGNFPGTGIRLGS